MLVLDPELWPMTKVGPDSPATFRKARLFVMLLDEGAEMGSCELHFLIDFSITDVGASSTRILGKHTLPSGWADLRWTGAMWSIRSFRILSAWHSKTGTRAGKQEHAFWCCIHVCSCVCVWTRILAGYMKFLGLLVKCSMAAIYWMYLIVFVRYVYVYVFMYTRVYSFSSPQLSNVDVYAVFFHVITQRITCLRV